jgi:hypothetical protein
MGCSAERSEMSDEDNNGPAGRPHHGNSHEIPPIVNPELLDPAARARIETRLRQLAGRRDISRAYFLVGQELVRMSRYTGSPADLFKTARQEEHPGYTILSKPRLPLRLVLEDGFAGKSRRKSAAARCCARMKACGYP